MALRFAVALLGVWLCSCVSELEAAEAYELNVIVLEQGAASVTGRSTYAAGRNARAGSLSSDPSSELGVTTSYDSTKRRFVHRITGAPDTFAKGAPIYALLVPRAFFDGSPHIARVSVAPTVLRDELIDGSKINTDVRFGSYSRAALHTLLGERATVTLREDASREVWFGYDTGLNAPKHLSTVLSSLADDEAAAYTVLPVSGLVRRSGRPETAAKWLLFALRSPFVQTDARHPIVFEESNHVFMIESGRQNVRQLGERKKLKSRR